MKPKPHTSLEDTFGDEDNYSFNKAISLNFEAKSFKGKAEILTYELTKARYDSVHLGEAILVQVVEPFIYTAQVKNDKGQKENSFDVLKSNYFERFTTGIYDYSLMTSTFTPLMYDTTQHSIKTTSSVQDWCGQSFAQLNNKKDVEIQVRSYFQQEGDSLYHLDKAWQEDELMNLIRLSKAVLPTGEFNIIPKLSYTRTHHIRPATFKAVGFFSVPVDKKDSTLTVYTVQIPTLDKTITYYFDENDNNVITKMIEEYRTVFDGTLRRSVATLKGRKQLPYWNLNALVDTKYRDSLNLK